MEWYYAIAEERKGPVDESELRALANQGTIRSDTLVWRDGLPDWVRYSEFAPPALPTSVASDQFKDFCADCGAAVASDQLVKLADQKYCPACKSLALQRFREGQSLETYAEITRKKHIRHEASVKSIGTLYFMAGVFCFLIAVIAFFAAKDAETRFGSLIIFLISIGQFAIGINVRRLKKWTRIPLGILSGIGLFGFPFGTIINAYILYLVFCEKGGMVFSSRYQAIIAETPHIKYRTPMWMIILLILVVALVVGLVILGVSRG